MLINTNIDPQKVAQHFTNSHATYGDNATVQNLINDKLVQALANYAPKSPARALEIGCGTGNLTNKLCQNHIIGTLYLNDLYDKITQNHLSTTADVRYLIGDIETLTLPDKLDLVVSGSCLQWVKDLSCVCQKVQNALVADGVFAFSSFAERNFYQIKQLTGQGLDYHTLTQVGQIIQGANLSLYRLWERQYTLYFDHPHAVLKHIQSTGVSGAGANFCWTKSRLQQFYQEYQQFAIKDDGTWRYPLTYHAIFCVAKKQD